MRLGIDAGLLIVAFFLGLAVQNVFGAQTFDEKKWERIAANREIRIANERRYEACAFQCREKCQ